MNIYEPYSETVTEGSLLHLQIKYDDKVESNIVNKILPLLVLIVLFEIYVIANPTYLAWAIGALVFLVFSAIVIMQSKTRNDIIFNSDSIQLETKRVFGRKVQTILLTDADFIDVEIYDEPRISGAFYRLILKNNKRVFLFRISGFTSSHEERFNEINGKLELMTGLQIHHDWKGL